MTPRHLAGGGRTEHRGRALRATAWTGGSVPAAFGMKNSAFRATFGNAARVPARRIFPPVAQQQIHIYY